MGKLIDAVLIQELPAANIKNANKANLWAFLWASTLITTMVMQDEGIVGLINPVFSLIATLIKLAVGITLVIAYRRMLLTIGEMERTIQYSALDLAVAATLLGYGDTSTLSKAELAPAIEASAILVIMSLTYCCGLIAGRLWMA